jgi:hypothetical protein
VQNTNSVLTPRREIDRNVMKADEQRFEAIKNNEPKLFVETGEA